jgi:hypothetical protein
MALIYPPLATPRSAARGRGEVRAVNGAFLFSVSTIATAAKIEVNGLGRFVLLQFAFHAFQFGAAGAVFGLIFGRGPAEN